MPKVLIFTEDPQLFLLLRHLLAVEGFEAELSAGIDADIATETESERTPPVLLLDKAGDRFSEFLRFKEFGPDIPSVLLARADVRNETEIYDRFDLILKWPFEPLVLLRFLQQQRTGLNPQNEPGSTQTILTYYDLLLHRPQFRVFRNGHNIDLTPLQFRLLETLMEKPEVVWNRQDLIDVVWVNGANVEPRTVDIHIGHLRRALADYGPNLIRTVHARGYALDQSAEPWP
ncbi:transcriptional regulatory, C terminal family protein [Ochrobactrum quorumnocens]|uniref:Transcriptional regulatory, C terminal family protein n=1 Tax=Ochrobactrum quorumnocens TaxID=271865 RepID=A0A248UDU8_9HYPH|nr:response regulator transcription factor [[Ochrobactrum] quorumnocens]ASV84571.1 transcriptional regulatory, C terminal family protein [[Ochrobactrum] quorumnocens]